jgi:hypothetical protein
LLIITFSLVIRKQQFNEAGAENLRWKQQERDVANTQQPVPALFDFCPNSCMKSIKTIFLPFLRQVCNPQDSTLLDDR